MQCGWLVNTSSITSLILLFMYVILRVIVIYLAVERARIINVKIGEPFKENVVFVLSENLQETLYK